MIKFEPASRLGRGKHIKVLSTTRGPIGWISEGQDKVYRYHEPYSNELNPTYSHTDLEALEDVVRRLRS
jgi:hypothetical protein